MTTVIVYVKGGMVQGAQSTDPETKVVVYDQDNIDAGDPAPFSHNDLAALQTKATPNCAAEIKLGKFYDVY
jgi:hypothetical protein